VLAEINEEQLIVAYKKNIIPILKEGIIIRKKSLNYYNIEQFYILYLFKVSSLNYLQLSLKIIINNDNSCVTK
jgi:hypothetical protein